jgi:tRNA U34 5-methylaminomethyl-2-thiouridine-forming methyltransferase MnmC
MRRQGTGRELVGGKECCGRFVGVPTLFLFVLMRTDPMAEAGAADQLEFWTFLQKFFLGLSSHKLEMCFISSFLNFY